MAKYWYTPRQSYSAPYSFSKNCLTKPKIEFRRNFSGMPACEHVCMCICMYMHAYGSQKSTLGVIISNWILCFWGRVSLIWNSLRKLAWLASDPSDPCVCVSLPSAGTTSVCYNAWLLFVCGARDWTQVVMLTKRAIYWLATPGHNIGVFTHSPLTCSELRLVTEFWQMSGPRYYKSNFTNSSTSDGFLLWGSGLWGKNGNLLSFRTCQMDF